MVASSSMLAFGFSAALAIIVSWIAIVDIRELRIPDALNGSVLLLGLAATILIGQHSLAWAVASSVMAAATVWVIGATYHRLRGRTGLGLGDVKFVGAAAAWIGIEQLPLLMLVASASALLCVAAWSIATRSSPPPSTRLPFGPFLGLSLLAVWGSWLLV